MASATSASATPGDGDATTRGLGLSADPGLPIGRMPTATVGATSAPGVAAVLGELQASVAPSASRASITATAVVGIIERRSGTTRSDGTARAVQTSAVVRGGETVD